MERFEAVWWAMEVVVVREEGGAGCGKRGGVGGKGETQRGSCVVDSVDGKFGAGECSLRAGGGPPSKRRLCSLIRLCHHGLWIVGAGRGSSAHAVAPCVASVNRE